MRLTESDVLAAVPRAKAYKLADGLGLYLLVTIKGAKYWRFKYRFQGCEKTLALGVYPNVSLEKARERLAEARFSLKGGIDPGTLKHEARLAEQRIKSNQVDFRLTRTEAGGLTIQTKLAAFTLNREQALAVKAFLEVASDRDEVPSC